MSARENNTNPRETHDKNTLNNVPLHLQPITHGLDTGQVGEIGTCWYGFLRAVLQADRIIAKRRAARQQTQPQPAVSPSEQVSDSRQASKQLSS